MSDLYKFSQLNAPNNQGHYNVSALEAFKAKCKFLNEIGVPIQDNTAPERTACQADRNHEQFKKNKAIEGLQEKDLQEGAKQANDFLEEMFEDQDK